MFNLFIISIVMTDFAKKIRKVPDFPKKGILFWDFTTLWQDAAGFGGMVDAFADQYDGLAFDKVASIESRGFVIGAPLAYRLGKGFVMIRKEGKLPSAKVAQSYEKEYGKDVIEMHEDSIGKGERVLLIDDLLATGDTAMAAVKLIERLGGEVVGIGFIVEFTDFGAQARFGRYDVFSLIKCSEVDG